MEKIERSRFTNGLHMQLYLLMEQVMDMAEDGVDDNLDPGCVKIFKRALEQAEIVQQSIKAELQGHMKQGQVGVDPEISSSAKTAGRRQVTLSGLAVYGCRCQRQGTHGRAAPSLSKSSKQAQGKMASCPTDLSSLIPSPPGGEPREQRHAVG